MLPSSDQELAVGKIVTVISSFESNNAENNRTLQIGERGVVEQLNAEGTALIGFNSDKKWVFQTNFFQLRVEVERDDAKCSVRTRSITSKLARGCGLFPCNPGCHSLIARGSGRLHAGTALNLCARCPAHFIVQPSPSCCAPSAPQYSTGKQDIT